MQRLSSEDRLTYGPSLSSANRFVQSRYPTSSPSSSLFGYGRCLCPVQAPNSVIHSTSSSWYSQKRTPVTIPKFGTVSNPRYEIVALNQPAAVESPRPVGYSFFIDHG
ncbi:hypothetical protein QAD02_014668 [Eretmocerus hayati]|uniref:Uncharacterized protein n=1 Tax=Eretmocerus hayati TaxID=131215 RepID=A0ACC2P7N0_9HYME|nr:hypothetical protein QAD02_014668 [Eretmocerus hayati]